MARDRSGRRTDYTWSGSVGILNDLAETNLMAAVAAFTASFTLYRVRGSWTAILDPPADGAVKVVAAGLIVVTTDAFSAGVSAVPSPIDDLDASWLWHDFQVLSSEGADPTEALVAYRGRVDGKAMRKVKSNETLVFVTDGENLGGTQTADVTMAIRILLGS